VCESVWEREAKGGEGEKKREREREREGKRRNMFKEKVTGRGGHRHKK
jgi:hypothetical protein